MFVENDLRYMFDVTELEIHVFLIIAYITEPGALTCPLIHRKSRKGLKTGGEVRVVGRSPVVGMWGNRFF